VWGLAFYTDIVSETPTIGINMTNSTIKLDQLEKAPQLVIEYGDVTTFTFNNLEDWPGDGVEKYFQTSLRIQRKESLIKKGQASGTTITDTLEVIKLVGQYGLNNEEDRIKWGVLANKEQALIVKEYMKWNEDEATKKKADQEKKAK
jgi:hypothetical protein